MFYKIYFFFFFSSCKKETEVILCFKKPLELHSPVAIKDLLPRRLTLP